MTTDVIVLTIDQLPTASNLSTTDIFPILQGGVTKSATFSILPFVQSGSAPSPETVQTALRRFVFAAQYTGYDPTGATDSTTAFNNARTAALGKTLIITGTPLISSALSITSQEHWIFDGPIGASLAGTPASYLIKKSTLNAALVTISGGAAYGTLIENGGIQGQNGNGGDGYSIQANGVVLIRPWVVSMGRDGINVGGGANQNSYKIIHPVCVSNGRRGIYVNDAGSNANSGIIDSPVCLTNTDDGIQIGIATRLTILNPLCENNTGYGVHLANGSVSNTIEGGDINETNTAGQLILDSGANNNLINNTNYGTLTNNGTDNIILGGNQSNITIGGSFAGIGGSAKVKSTSAGTQAVTLWNSDTTGFRYLIYGGSEASFTARGAIGIDASGRFGITNTAGNGLFVDSNGDILWGKALVTLGGGSAPTVGTIGGSGPASAAQNSWLRLLDSAGNACFVPVWK